MKKALKWFAVALLAPVVLTALLAVALYIPPIQNWAVRHVASYASEQTGMDIRVGHVRLAFPLDLSVEEVMIIKNAERPGLRDTIADVKQVVVDVQLLPLFRGQVEVDELAFNGMKVNTDGLIPDVHIAGAVGHLSVESHGINLGAEEACVDKALLTDANVQIELADTVPPDTTKSEPLWWKILVRDLSVQRTSVSVLLPTDSLPLTAYLGDVRLKGGNIDLGARRYEVGRLGVADSRVAYGPYALSNLSLAASSFYMDSLAVRVSSLKLNTPESNLVAKVNMDLNTFASQDPGRMDVIVHGAFGKQDLLSFMGGLPPAFRRQWPNQQLTIDAVVKGNMQRAFIHGLTIKLPSAFTLQADGQAGNLADSKSLFAELNIHAATENLSFVTSLLDTSARPTLRLPAGMSLDGKLRADGQCYASDFTFREGRGSVKGRAMVDVESMRYDIDLRAQALQLQHFLPGSGLHPLTGTVNLSGHGTDPLSTRTGLQANIDVKKFGYGAYDLANIQATATVKNGVSRVRARSNNPLVQGVVNLDGISGGRRMKATLSCDLAHADLYSLRLVEEPMVIGLCAHLDLETDMKKFYKVQGLVSDIYMRDSVKLYRPDDIVLDVLTNRDTTLTVVDCGDFHLNLHARGGYEDLLHVGKEIAEEVNRQYDARTIDQLSLRRRLPLASVRLTSGRENFIINMLRHYGITLHWLNLKMDTSPLAGINGNLHINGLTVDSVLLDTINFAVKSDSARISYQAQVRNNKKNPQYTFNALVDGIIFDKGTILGTRLYDDRNQLGVRLGIQASMENNGFMFRSYGPDPTLGYKTFTINKDNYVFLGPDQRVSADVKLLAADGMGVQIYSNDEDSTAQQDITFSLNKFDLEKILSVIPYTPDLGGMMNGDFHVIKTDKALSVSTNLAVDRMSYEKTLMGDIATEFVYMPQENGGHYVDGILMHDDRQVASISGTYLPDDGGNLNADLSMERFPLALANAFVPRQLIGLKGYGEGTLSVSGRLSAPVIDGELFLDSAYIFSEPYGVTLRFDNDPVTIKQSRLLLENFNMYAINDQPLTSAGYIDFADPEHIHMDMRMRAQNFQVIKAKENSRSEAFGKAFVNFFGVMRGELDNLSVRGKLDVLGSTDMTYILRDSPLTTDNQLDELVKFTDFSDTTTVKSVKRPQLTGLNMDITLSIDESAHIMCALNADKSNYVDLIGGGDLRMQYNPTDNFRLTGRYTLSNGEMKYSLPVIPLKTFTIRDGSYIEFTGNVMNPRLNITATEQTKASVGSEGSQSRMVEFECGVVITKNLKDMGLEFIIEALQDMEVSNELNMMSKEERGKLAVTMLTTGMYLSDGNTSSFSMNSALSAFLNSQINGIAGNALRTLDLSFGMDNATDANGNLHTDYSFKFAKRLWDNRLRIIIGGKLSTGSDVSSQNQTFFNNVQFEYRLNEGSSKFLKLFYNRDSYDWLEGEIGQYGAGFIWRRKLSHFQELFRFKDSKTTMPVMRPMAKPSGETQYMRAPADSTKTN